MQHHNRVLVTGGGGYIGSHTAWLLKESGYTPIIVDSLVNGYRWAAASFGFFEEGDIGDNEFIRRLCHKYEPSALMHFAAFIEVNESVRNPQKYFTNNFDKARVLFDTVRECGIRDVVFSSSAAVYGAGQALAPIKEDAPLQPVNPYGESKVRAEAYLRATGMRSVSLRYFNVAGAAPVSVGIGEAHFPESHLLPRVILSAVGIDPQVLKALELSRSVSIFGTDYPTEDGTSVRDYTHVIDLAKAHILALQYLAKGGETDIFNLGSKKGYSVRDVIKTAEEILGRRIPVTEEPRRAGDPPYLIADSSKAEKILGWKRQFGLEEMIESGCDWHKSMQYKQAILSR